MKGAGHSQPEFPSSHSAVVVLLSGGIDSFACAHFFLKQRCPVSALHISHGQASSTLELQSARRICGQLKIELQECVLRADNRFAEGELPGRNAFLLFSALLVSKMSEGLLAIGIHAGNNYYDCSPHFLSQVRQLVKNCTGGRIDVVAPFIEWTKHEIITYCLSESLPLALTYSCELGAAVPCGRCASCRDREGLLC